MVQQGAVLVQVEATPGVKRSALAALGTPRSTYYFWRRRQRDRGHDDRPRTGGRYWNSLTPQEERSVLEAARGMPGLSSRQLAARTMDNRGLSKSESTVYSILRRLGLVERPEVRLVAGKEYRRRTTGAHYLWGTDASYFRVAGCLF